MRKIILTDVTLKDSVKDGESRYTFKERVEIAKVLDKLGTDTIRLSPIVKQKADTMAIRTVCAVVKSSRLSLPVGLTKESVAEAWNALSAAKKPELYVGVPTSPVCLEYLCHKKPQKAIDMIKELVTEAKKYTENVNFGAEDATRTDKGFLKEAIEAAIGAGATDVTVCDTAGKMLASEFGGFIKELYENIPALQNVRVSVQCCDALYLAAANEVAAVEAGANGVCVTVGGTETAAKIPAVAEIFRMCGDRIDICTDLKTTELKRSLKQLGLMRGFETRPDEENEKSEEEGLVFDENDGISEISAAIVRLGYDLSDEDITKVYESFQNVAKKKTVGAKELEAIIATVALQVPQTYKLESYVINSGNNITATAHVKIEKDGQKHSVVAMGDGPIAAAFSAIDNIVGKKYELDDFQIQSVTEGFTSIGTALVKLRADSKLYSGNGVSTDIIDASIRAYVSAINKIAYEEKA